MAPNHYQNQHGQIPAPPRCHRRNCRQADGTCIACGETKRPGFIGRTMKRIFTLALLFTLLIFAGGTLKSTGHPGAVRFGEALHTVTFTEEIQHWAFAEGHDAVFASVNFLSRGVDVSRWVHQDGHALTSY